ncbi:BREX system serine/threonine kinase PglW [Dactylosporangium sp. NPDC005572]|uniref:BREX system serine/threonine kinase PglW n=1 Tax=Dactylosporangium sp. NPDC005572 TaxID=3156889 RepID=UPI0033A46E61
MQEGRWTTVTPSQFVHEREALAHVQQLLPDAEPYRAWSNFTFTADTGHVYEVDLLVATPSGLYLIEIKSLRGRLTNSGSNWLLGGGEGTRTFDNPLHLADAKAKRLRSLLGKAAGNNVKVPFIQAAVFLSVPSLQIALSDNQLHWVYGPEGTTQHQLPHVGSDLLLRPPMDEHRRVTPSTSRALPELLKKVGIARSRKHYQIGSWQLAAKPIDQGPTWQDHLARHSQLDNEHRRVRIYLVERNAVQSERASIDRAAKREMLALHGINHPGIVQVDALEQHEAGPALVFRYDPRSLRLDHYLAQYGAKLDVATRVGMVRQLSEALAYAHGRHLHHRALSARSVLITPGPRRRGSEEEAWLRPHLQISDWQTASRSTDSNAGSSAAGPLLVSPTSHVNAHIEQSAQGYLAPEIATPEADPVALDVFGLGTVTYLLLAGKPPANTRAELLARLANDNGLRPSADADSVSEFMDEVVQAATAPQPAQRLSTIAEFNEMLELVENELTAPEPPAVSVSVHPEVEQPDDADLLEARGGDVFGEWRIERRLGTGSTSRAFLARNLGSTSETLVVLKAALSDEKATRLEHEAAVLRKLVDSRIIRLARQEPIPLGRRTVLVLDHAGDLTVARKLREDGRLTVDELETYSEYLFGAVDYLDGEGVHHRDIKPDNIAIRVRPNRTRQLVLFDFSLAATDVKQTTAGTPRYLDPFIGTVHRPVYDAHAERYAVAVTLHEMASGELPVWGDGVTEPQFTEGRITLASEAFDPAIRDGLVEFFHRSLDRDAKRRFETLKEMRDAWLQVFRKADATVPVGSRHPETDDETADAEILASTRDAAAAAATRATSLEAAGLSPRAISAAHRLDATTVGRLLGLAGKVLFNLPGMGAKTRQELQRRIKEWRTRLGEQEPTPQDPTERKAAKDEIAAGGPVDAELARVGIDAIAALLLPPVPKHGKPSTEAEGVRLLLRLPDAGGHLPALPAWPQQPAVAKQLKVTSGRVAQILIKQRKRWAAEPVVADVRAEILTILGDNGRVMGVHELAAVLLSRRGSARTGDELRLALANAAVRGAVEVDTLAEEPRLKTRRHGDTLLVALEVGRDESPNTPSAPALLDYADALGAVADRLAALDVLPSPATVLRELTAIPPPAGAALDERRLVQLAAVASRTAAASPRLEIYSKTLDPVRALRLAQAGVVPPSITDPPVGLRPTQIQQRVSARFPDLLPLPPHPKLDTLLTDAGFQLQWRDGQYLPPRSAASSSASLVNRRRSTRVTGAHWTVVDSPELAAALRAEERLDSARTGGFRALTVRVDRANAAQRELTNRFDARALNVAAMFMTALRELVAAKAKPTWETVLRADTAPPGSRDAIKLAEYMKNAWTAVRPKLLAQLNMDCVLLLHDAALLPRYGAMDLLHELTTLAESGAGAAWLLCPVDDPGALPRLDGTVVPVGDNQWIPLPDTWVANEHRSGAQAS